jgi:hypothetical protein
MNDELIFVYNANSSLFSTVTDFAHKILSPSTYQCQLCALTYGNFGMKQEWKSFIEGLSLTTSFLHKDEFEKKYETKAALPAIFLSKEESVEELITKHEIENCQSLIGLKNLITAKIETYVQHHHTNI